MKPSIKTGLLAAGVIAAAFACLAVVDYSLTALNEARKLSVECARQGMKMRTGPSGSECYKQ